MEEFTKVIKSLFREKMNIVILILAALFGFNIYGFVKIKNKIDHRYFNTTKTLEQIHNVHIDTKNGELKKVIIKS